MKVLYVCHRFPFPPKRGGKIRPFNMIRHLHQQGHEVVVASLVRSEEEAQAGVGLREHCSRFLMERVHDETATVRMVLRLPTKGPSSMGYFYSAALERRIQAELARTAFDLIFVHCSSVAPYVAQAQGPAKILDFGDMDSQKWLSYGPMKPFPLSLGYYLEGLKMQLAEAELAKQFDCCTATTKAELATLNGLGTAHRTDWFPNGVDTKAFAPAEQPYEPDTICFIGRMDYYPNQECMLEFCKDTWPLILGRRPKAQLLIIGAEPSAEIKALGALPGVTVTGSVPEVQPYVHRAAVNVAPLNIARGTQNKILESMAMGVPVVASQLAAAGVDAVPGEHLLVGSRPEEYADQILHLLDHPEERRRYSEAGRARVLSHHDWKASMKRLDGIIEATLNDKQKRQRSIG